MKTVKQYMDEQGMSVKDLAERSSLEKRIAQHIMEGQWTPSPQQRERIAATLGVKVDEIRWGHTTPVEHMYGHGPQFGRSP
jgi:ribosome-binding protein aMBF1 (putative translation factor)